MHRLAFFLLLLGGSVGGLPGAEAEQPLRQFRETRNSARAVARVRSGEHAAQPIPKFITGKFAGNTLENPHAIAPKTSEMDLRGRQFQLELAPYTWVRARVQ